MKYECPLCRAITTIKKTPIMTVYCSACEHEFPAAEALRWPDVPTYETTGNREELVLLNGYVYLHSRGPEWDEPTILHLFYPTGVRGLLYTMPRKVRPYGSDTYLDDHDALWRLVSGGQTKPDPRWTYTEDVPKPTRCKEVRWSYGRWEKYTRAHGWECV